MLSLYNKKRTAPEIAAIVRVKYSYIWSEAFIEIHYKIKLFSHL